MTEEEHIEQMAGDQLNPAVVRCCRVWQLVYDQNLEDTSTTQFEAQLAANTAFRNAMPPLLGSENIRDFIACVATGLLKGDISCKEAPRLLYAAQIAVSADGSRKLLRK